MGQAGDPVLPSREQERLRGGTGRAEQIAEFRRVKDRRAQKQGRGFAGGDLERRIPIPLAGGGIEGVRPVGMGGVFDGILGQDAECERQTVLGDQGQAGMAGEVAEGGGGREWRDLLGEGVGMEQQVADTQVQQAVELFVRGDALVERFILLEDALEVAGGDGGGIAVHEADA